MASGGRRINKKWYEMCVGGLPARGLIWYKNTILIFACSYWRNPLEMWFGFVGAGSSFEPSTFQSANKDSRYW